MASALLKSISLPGKMLSLRQGFHTLLWRLKQVDQINRFNNSGQKHCVRAGRRKWIKHSLLLPFLVTILWVLKSFALLGSESLKTCHSAHFVWILSLRICDLPQHWGWWHPHVEIEAGFKHLSEAKKIHSNWRHSKIILLPKNQFTFNYWYKNGSKNKITQTTLVLPLTSELELQ